MQVQYLPKWASWGFLPALTYAERCLAAFAKSKDRDETPDTRPPLFYVSYRPVAKRSPLDGGRRCHGHSIRWRASGPTVGASSGSQVSINVNLRGIGLWMWEQHDKAVRLAAIDEHGTRQIVQLQLVTAADAQALQLGCCQKPRRRHMCRRWLKARQFVTALSRLTPHPYVTPTLIGINAIMFVIVVASGGGLFVPNPETMIRFGTGDLHAPYAGGAMVRRLLTSIFLHFGLMHVALQHVSALRERPDGRTHLRQRARYLVIYLVAGVTGSLALACCGIRWSMAPARQALILESSAHCSPSS